MSRADGTSLAGTGADATAAAALAGQLGGSNDHRQEQAHAVHQHVALAHFDPLAAVKASCPVGEAT